MYVHMDVHAYTNDTQWIGYAVVELSGDLILHWLIAQVLSPEIPDMPAVSSFSGSPMPER